MTVIAFSEARWSADVSSFPQHTMLFLWVRRQSRRPAEAEAEDEESAMEDVHPTREYGKWRVDEGRVERLPAFYPPARGEGA